MKSSDTKEKKLDVLLKTQQIMHRELLFNLKFHAFLTGFMTLKLKNLNERIKQALEMWELGKITELTVNEEYQKEQRRKREEEEGKAAEDARKRAEAFKAVNQ